MSEQPQREDFNDPPDRKGEMDLAKVHGSILREHREPAEGLGAVPLWLVGVITVLVFWGGIYLASHSGGFRADVFNPQLAPIDGGLAAMPPGERIYTQNCVLCHQANGQGIPGIYPPLAGSDWVQAKRGAGDNHLVNIVLYGLQGPLQVQGRSYNGAMPTWSILSDEDIAQVLTYIRQQWGNDAPPISADFVRAVRARDPDRFMAWTEEELKALPPQTSPALPTTPPSPKPAP